MKVTIIGGDLTIIPETELELDYLTDEWGEVEGGTVQVEYTGCECGCVGSLTLVRG